MPYITEQTSAELRAHVRSLQATPGWHHPLVDRMFIEIQALEAQVKALRDGEAKVAVAEVIECPVMGQQSIREIDGKWRWLSVGEKLYAHSDVAHTNT